MFQQQYSLGRWIIKSNCCPSTLISVEYLRSQALSLSLSFCPSLSAPCQVFRWLNCCKQIYTVCVCVCVHVCCQPVILLCCFVIVFIFVLLNRAIHVAAVQLQNRCLYSAQIKTTKGITRATAATTLTATTPAVATTAACCMLTFMLHALWLHLSGILLVANCSGFKYSIHAGDWLQPLFLHPPPHPRSRRGKLKTKRATHWKMQKLCNFQVSSSWPDLPVCRRAGWKQEEEVGVGDSWRGRRFAFACFSFGFRCVVVVVVPFLFTNMQKRNCVLSCLC